MRVGSIVIASVEMELRIPMRGYETPEMVADAPSLTGYESPCGVMRRATIKTNPATLQLRIPMRGYELKPPGESPLFQGVTNPHAGL